MNIRQLFLSIVNDKEAYTKKDEKTIVSEYNNLSQKDKESVDKIFISLTGYKLVTIINESDSNVFND